MVKNRWKELFKLVGIILLAFAIGLMPYIDNFAHVGGFVFGFVR